MGKKYIYDRTRKIVRHYTVKNCDPMTGPLKELIVLAADSAGYSRLMGEDDAATVRDLKGHQAVILPLIDRYGGRLIDTAGDGILAEFPSVIGAVECAVEIQTVMAARHAEIPEPRRPRFRMGINLGDVMYGETRIYGDGINVAARLEGIAEPGGICISR
jgi:adenylate cyclase